jgi:hypothetical protein
VKEKKNAEESFATACAPGRTNAIGALIGRRLLTVGLFQAAINADAFRPWIERDASPKLPPRSVLVMDDAAFHKRAAIQSFIRKRRPHARISPRRQPRSQPRRTETGALEIHPKTNRRRHPKPL